MKITNYHRQIRCDERHSTFHVLVDLQLEIIQIDGHIAGLVYLSSFCVGEQSSGNENPIEILKDETVYRKSYP